MFDCAPVLLHNFRRPEFTRRQIDMLRMVKPGKVFFSADAPRDGNEQEIRDCSLVRALAQEIDWPCETMFLLQEKNVGPKVAISSAVSWFFRNVDMGIVLEDDVLPSMDFFRFATECLWRYRDDERVGLVSGCNRYGLQTSQAESYHFASHANIWGWATWRRVWRHYDVDITRSMEDGEVWAILERGILTKRARRAFAAGLAALDRGLQTWDYQLALMLMARDMLAIVPRRQLVRNLGIGDANGANTGSYNFDAYHLKRMGHVSFPLVHPPAVVPDLEALLMEERREFAILPRTLTWLGCKIPAVAPTCESVGRCLERIVPRIFSV